MDTLTHALSGALLACATVPAERHNGSLSLRQRMAAGFAAAAFPDCDFGLRLIDTLTYLNLHRGFTHSVVMLPVWSLGLSLLFAAFTRGQVHWRAFYGVALLGIGIHIVQDLITSYGTMVFSPFSNWKPAIPLAFILDPYFTAIVVTGLLASALWAPRRHPAVIALAALAGYVALQAVLHQQATRIGEAYAAVRGFTDGEVQALPQPLSPFNWKIIVSSADAHHEAFVNLARTEERPSDSQKWLLARIDAGYQPPSAATWIRWPRVELRQASRRSRARRGMRTRWLTSAGSPRYQPFTASIPKELTNACGLSICALLCLGSRHRSSTGSAGRGLRLGNSSE